MKKILACLFLTALTMTVSLTHTTHAATRIPLNESWHFHLGDVAATTATLPPDIDWRLVDVPHDWSIELPTDAHADTGTGGGFFTAGTGWYRKTFEAPAAWRDQLVSVYFEGVYRNAEVWMNGKQLGSHAYGYTPFRVDLSEHLRFDEPNTLAVRVANVPQPNSRWYSGSGIYRPVWIEVRPMIHFEPESIVVTTRVLSTDEATLGFDATIANADQLQGDEHVAFTLVGPDGNEVAAIDITLDNKKKKPTFDLTSRLTIADPAPWSPEQPQLYTLRARLLRGESVLEESILPIGLRTLRWSSQRGFELNGQSIKLFGGNVHHDNGPLGAAAFTGAEWRKVAVLKRAGFNAVRTSHNPPSEEFLRACDHLGLLVIDEAFDMWKAKKTDHDYSEIFDENWDQDIRAMVRRDRNHPSVVMWSIGNEVYERGKDEGVERAHGMAAIIRQLDRSRPVTIGLNGLGKEGDWTRLDTIFDGLDAAGYNYELHRHAEDHERRPNRIIFSSESYQNEAFANWKMSQENTYVIGDFVWSALDYLGESGIGRVFPPDEEARGHWVGDHFPWHGAYCGDIDLTGWRKPISHYRNIVWNRGETLYAAVIEPTPDGRSWNLSPWSVPPALPSWTWPGFEGRDLVVEVYSRHPSVRLFLNNQLIGEALTGETEEFKASFTVPYQAGTLVAKGGDETFTLQTATEPQTLVLEIERVNRNGGNPAVHFIALEIQDAEGVLHPLTDRPIEFSIEGAAEMLAVGSGDLSSLQSYRSNPRQSFQGRALVVVRTRPDAKGEIIIRAEAEGLESTRITLPVSAD